MKYSDDRLLVGVCGGSWEKPGVGKTTVANILAKNFSFHPVSFIDPVKDVAKRLFGWDGTMDDKARVLLDRICRVGREVSEHYWRDMALSRVPADQKRIVFDDMYFEDEFRMIVENKGIVLRVVRSGFGTPSVPCETVDVSNDGSLNELQRSVLLATKDAFQGRL